MATSTRELYRRYQNSLGQFLRFGLVGGSGVLVNMLVAVIMTKLHGGTVHDNDVVVQLTARHALRFTVLVWVVAFLVANFWNFELNRRWTFQREHRRSWWAEFWPFFLVGAVAAAAGMVIKVALTNPTSPLYLPGPLFNDHQGLRARAYWAQLLTIVLTMPINFIVNKLWTFRAVHHAHAPMPDVAPVAGLADSVIEEVADAPTASTSRREG